MISGFSKLYPTSTSPLDRNRQEIGTALRGYDLDFAISWAALRQTSNGRFN